MKKDFFGLFSNAFLPSLKNASHLISIFPTGIFRNIILFLINPFNAKHILSEWPQFYIYIFYIFSSATMGVHDGHPQESCFAFLPGRSRVVLQ